MAIAGPAVEECVQLFDTTTNARASSEAASSSSSSSPTSPTSHTGVVVTEDVVAVAGADDDDQTTTTATSSSSASDDDVDQAGEQPKTSLTSEPMHMKPATAAAAMTAVDDDDDDCDSDGTSRSTTRPDRRLEEGRAAPSTRFGRAPGFANLGVGLAWGAVGEMVTRVVVGGIGGGVNNENDRRETKDGHPASSSSSSPSVVTTDANADRLAATSCGMRGAALKMGQMSSIQDESLSPPALTRALQQVRRGAEAMPSWQLQRQLQQQLGPTWESKFVSFDDRPFTAALIGQVHRARIVRRWNAARDRNDKTAEDGNPDHDHEQDDDDHQHDEEGSLFEDVVVKVQFPGVAESIESDLGNLSMLVRMSGLSPKGLFIENVIRVGRDEIKVECDHLNELANQETFQKLVHTDPVLQANRFVVPDVIEELSTEQALTTSCAPGETIDAVAQIADQNERNRIGRTMLCLTMQELFEWRSMQTDPNWGNFLCDPTTRAMSLIDFGATREFPKSFVDGHSRIVWASANQDETTLMAQSHGMKFLTGEENDVMLNAHKRSGFTVGEPFWKDEPFDFRGSNISSRMGERTSVFLRHRLMQVTSFV